MAQTVSDPFTLRVNKSPPPVYLTLLDSIEGGPAWIMASPGGVGTSGGVVWGCDLPWNNPGGDWFDLNETAQGSTPYASLSTNVTANVPINVVVTPLVAWWLANRNSGMHLRSSTQVILAMREHGADGPKLSVTTGSGTFNCPCVADVGLNASSALPQVGPTLDYFGTALLRFDLSAVTGTPTRATLTITPLNGQGWPTTITVNRLQMPRVIYDPATEIGGVQQGIASTVAVDSHLKSHPAVLTYSAPASNAQLVADEFSAIDNPGDPQFGTWTDLGIPYLRITMIHPGGMSMRWIITPSPSSGARWQRTCGNGYDEMRCRYLLEIEVGNYANLTQGVKLVGMEGLFSQFGNQFSCPSVGGGWSARTELSTKVQSAPGYYRVMAAYWYGPDNPVGGGFGKFRWCNLYPVFLKEGKRYCIEQYLRMNTPNGVGGWNADGILKLWIDGVLVHNETNIVYRVNQSNQFENYFANCYHGGTVSPTGPIHYRFSGFCMTGGTGGTSATYIGPPTRVA